MKILMNLILLLGLCATPAQAAQALLAEPALSRELQQLEDDFHPAREFRERVASLVAQSDSYPPDVDRKSVV